MNRLVQQNSNNNISNNLNNTPNISNNFSKNNYSNNTNNSHKNTINEENQNQNLNLNDNSTSLLNNPAFKRLNSKNTEIGSNSNNNGSNNYSNYSNNSHNTNSNANSNNHNPPSTSIDSLLSNVDLGPVKKKIKNMHDYTKVGFSGYGAKKVNQDNFFMFKNFVGNPNHIFMSVW